MNKLQNVVFFIGAGFSAPYGIPVMSTFIDKARDLFFSNTAKYVEVGKTLEFIEKYSSVKNYLRINLHNIEDLLSITYMDETINNRRSITKSISEFIKTVIIEYTGGIDSKLSNFASLFANVSKIQGSSSVFINNGTAVAHQFIPNGKACPQANFGLISLNYDLLMENAFENISKQLDQFNETTGTPHIWTPYYTPTKKMGEIGIQFSKLHGSVNGQIIPPTWNKTVNRSIILDWQLAANLLVNATHVIFLGYSLPITDNYIKYLFASSLNKNRRLKKILAITVDSDGETQKRYESLFEMKIKFRNMKTEDYLTSISNAKPDSDFDGLIENI
jgi:hypothetical protein